MASQESRPYDEQDIADLTSYLVYALGHSSHGCTALVYPNSLQVPTNLAIDFYIKGSVQKAEQHFGTSVYTSKVAFKDGSSSLYFFDFSPGKAFNPSFKPETLETRVSYTPANKLSLEAQREPYQLRPPRSQQKIVSTRAKYGWGKQNIKSYKPQKVEKVPPQGPKLVKETDDQRNGIALLDEYRTKKPWKSKDSGKKKKRVGPI